MLVHISIRPEAAPSFASETFDAHQFGEHLDALRAPPTISAIHDLAARIQHFNTLRVRIVDRQELSERIHNAVIPLVSQLEADLNDLTIPLSSEKRLLYNLADELLAAAASYQCLFKEQSRRLFGLASSGRALVPVQRLMIPQSRRIDLVYRVYATSPKGCWLALHEPHQFAVRRGLANRVVKESFIAPAVLYKRALLAAFAGPSRLTSEDREIVMALIDRHADRAGIAAPSPTLGEGSLFLIKPNRDQAGELLSKERLDTVQPKDLVLSVAAVEKTLLNEGATCKPMRAGDGSPAHDLKLRSNVEMLARQWRTGPIRQRNRLKTQAEVGIAVGLARYGRTSIARHRLGQEAVDGTSSMRVHGVSRLHMCRARLIP